MLTKQNAALAANLLTERAFDPSAPPPPDHCIFRMHYKRILNLGDYMLLTGKKGAGKSKVVAATLAAALTGNEIFMFNIKLPAGKGRVMHLDTEQGRTSHYRMMQLILKLAGIEGAPDHFKSYRCRAVPPHHIKLMVEYYLQITPDCGLILLDGMLDTVDNMNDVTESKRLKEWIERISEHYHVAIAGVMHRGFSADKAIGHSGSFLERGAQTVLKIQKENQGGIDYYVMSTEFIREDAPPPDTPFYYNIKTGSWELFEIMQADLTRDPGTSQVSKTGKNSPDGYDIQEHRRRVGQIFDSTGQFLRYDQLTSEIQIAYACSLKDAKGLFYQYLLNKFFWKTENGYTNKEQARLFVAK